MMRKHFIDNVTIYLVVLQLINLVSVMCLFSLPIPLRTHEFVLTFSTVGASAIWIFRHVALKHETIAYQRHNRSRSGSST